MKLTFVGTGSAFTVGTGNFHSNMLLENDDHRRLLIDCGTDVRWSLFDLGLNHRDINDVYISHLHSDHAGGLEWLAFTTKFDPKLTQKPSLFISETLVKSLWDNKLAAGLSSIADQEVTLSSYFDLHPVGASQQFTWGELVISLVKTIHIFNNTKLVPSFGLAFTIGEINVYITTDTQFTPNQLMPYYEKADIIFHDCGIGPLSPVHAHFSQLASLPVEIKNKIWLYHYEPTEFPDAKAAGFRGFVKKGQVFDFTRPATLEG